MGLALYVGSNAKILLTLLLVCFLIQLVLARQVACRPKTIGLLLLRVLSLPSPLSFTASQFGKALLHLHANRNPHKSA